MSDKSWEEIDAEWLMKKAPNRADAWPKYARGSEPSTAKPVTQSDVDRITYRDTLSPEERAMVAKFAEMD